MDDEVYRRLKDESTKAKQALEKAFQEKEAEKIKLQSIYKAMNKTEDELKTIFSEIESDQSTPSMPFHHEYHKLYWKWKNAENVHKNAQTKFGKYETNKDADIPDVMIELKELKQQNEELRKELQQMKELIPQMMKQQNEELMTLIKMFSFQYDAGTQTLNQNGQPFTGHYSLSLPNRDHFEGEFENGKPKPHGKGRMTFSNGNLFEGEFENGKPHGKGRMTFSNGNLFEGDFENGKPHGKGRMTFSTGDHFEGEFENGKPRGKGRMTFSNGKHLEGDFENGDYIVNPNFNGQNTETDIVFPQPVEARYITFKPKKWNSNPFLRCDVYVDGILQTTPLSQRTISSFNSDSEKDSTMNAKYGWEHKEPYNANEWLRLDLGHLKNITGIRVGTSNGVSSYYMSQLALEFEK